MEENTNTQESQTEQESNQEQTTQEESKGLLPGQAHEDELDYMGGALFGLVKAGFNWIKHFFIKQ